MIKLMPIVEQIQQEQLEEAGVKDIALGAAMTAASMFGSGKAQAQTPLEPLAKQTTTQSARTTTTVDGKVGSITSRYTFPGAFMKYLNTGDIENLGIQGNPELQRIAKENKLTNNEMNSWNDFVNWMSGEGYQGSTNMDKAGFRLKVINEYVKDHPNFFIDPKTADENGAIEAVKKVQNMLKIYRAYLIKQASKGKSEITVGGKKLNLISPDSPDWELVPQFMTWAK